MPGIATIQTWVLVETVLTFMWLQLAILSGLSGRHGTWRGSDIGFSSPNYLVLLSKYFRCIPGTPRILKVSGEVQREGSIEVKYEARSLE